MTRVARALALTALLASACETEDSTRDASDWHPVASVGPLAVYEALAPASPAPDVASLYFTVVNAGSEADTLLDVRAQRGRAQVHEVVTDGGITSMRRVAALPIGPGDTLRLRPGSYHVMLTQLDHPLALNDTLRVTLAFARAGTVSLPAIVLSYTDVVQRLEARAHRLQ